MQKKTSEYDLSLSNKLYILKLIGLQKNDVTFLSSESRSDL